MRVDLNRFIKLANEPHAREVAAHSALLHVVGEMWNEMQKFDGEERFLSISMTDIGGVVIGARVGFVGKDGKHHTLRGTLHSFSNIPDFLTTTMLFRDLEEFQRNNPK